MANAKHTPRPWRIVHADETTIWHDDGRVDHFVCSLFKNFGGDEEADRLRADAALISAAPDLLVALKALESISGTPVGLPGSDLRLRHTEALGAARATIAKAEGRV
jgi:hypothetical protein